MRGGVAARNLFWTQVCKRRPRGGRGSFSGVAPSLTVSLGARDRCATVVAAAELAPGNAGRLSTCEESVDDSSSKTCPAFIQALVVPRGELAGPMLIKVKAPRDADDRLMALATLRRLALQGALRREPGRLVYPTP